MIVLVISDVDGTLVTPDKQLTQSSVNAIQRLHERGIGFSFVSSRPPFGLRMLIEPLALKIPFGAFNGAAVVDPSLEVLQAHLVPESAAQRSAKLITDCGAELWVYTTGQWLVRDPKGAYVPNEVLTIQSEPTTVGDVSAYLQCAAKLVGVSEDFMALAQCEERLRRDLSGAASVARSQPYYLDVTPPGFNKGTFVSVLARRLATPREQIAVLGDMENDLAMFRCAGMSIAMGNASDAVKAEATAVTDSNAADGFAHAIDRFILST